MLSQREDGFLGSQPNHASVFPQDDHFVTACRCVLSTLSDGVVRARCPEVEAAHCWGLLHRRHSQAKTGHPWAFCGQHRWQAAGLSRTLSAARRHDSRDSDQVVLRVHDASPARGTERETQQLQVGKTWQPRPQPRFMVPGRSRACHVHAAMA